MVGLLWWNFNPPPDSFRFLNHRLDRLGWLDGFSLLRVLRLLDCRILPENLSLPLDKFALRLLNIEDVGHVPSPNRGQLVNRALPAMSKARGPVAGMRDVLAKLDFIRRENLHAFAPARNRDIPLLFVRGRFDGRIREQDVIHGFALSGVGRDSVAAHELAVVFWQCPAIIQCDAPIGMNLFHRDQFAVGELAAVLALAVCLELQPVASR